MGAVFGGESFYGNIRIVNGAKDPFASLFVPEEQWASIDWLVQRFACLNDFKRAKLILEYREPLPASLKGRGAGVQRGCAGIPRTCGQGFPCPIRRGPFAQGCGPVHKDAQCPFYGEFPRQHVHEGTFVPQRLQLMGPLPGWGRIARSFIGIAVPHEKGRLPPDIRMPCGWLRF